MKICGFNSEKGTFLRSIYRWVVEYWKMAIVTVAYVLFSSFTALFLDSLYTVVAMTGALGGSLIEAIIPAALYIKYVKEIRDVDAPWKTIGGWMVITLGAVIAVLGTYESLTQYFCFFEYICSKCKIITEWVCRTCYMEGY